MPSYKIHWAASCFADQVIDSFKQITEISNNEQFCFPSIVDDTYLIYITIKTQKQDQ